MKLEEFKNGIQVKVVSYSGIEPEKYIGRQGIVTTTFSPNWIQVEFGRNVGFFHPEELEKV